MSIPNWSLLTSPAPTIKAGKVVLRLEDIQYTACTSALLDFQRQRGYWLHRHRLRETGGDVTIVPVTGDTVNNKSIVRASRTWLLKEHGSASWGAHFFQLSAYGLTGITAVGTALTGYIGWRYNRLVLAVTPIGAVVTWRLWNIVENTWSQQRYIDNAALIREERKGNPIHALVKRRRVEQAEALRRHDESDVSDSFSA